jgi:eukaryotic-like serine/threonine-protein kinase
MTSMPPCPSDNSLRQLAAESLAPDIFAEIDAHIAGCDNCKQRLGRLVRECPSTESEAPICLPLKAHPPIIPGFEIERELGRGAMGVVYLARDQKLGRRVALKVMPGAQSSDGQARKRWRSEAQAFSRVRNPNVVSLHEIGETESWLFLVLEYIPGGTLKNRLSDPVPPELAARLLIPIASAVQTIHSAGLLHLDLKPSNILIDANEDTPLDRATPKVADFGVARLNQNGVADAAQTGATLMGPWGGTASYMAPEQIAGTLSDLGPGADIHALGAILYELLTGRPPFQGISVLHTLDMVRDTEAVSPKKINPRVSRDLETIALKCLQKDPKRRYESADALADDLKRFCEGRPILARRVSPPDRAWHWCRRRPAVASLIAAVAAFVLIGLQGLLAFLRHSETERTLAEAARHRSQENETMASSSITQLHALITSSELHTRLPYDGALDTFVQRTRQQIGGLTHAISFKTDTLAALGNLEREFGVSLLGQNPRIGEAQELVGESVEFLTECLKRRSHDEGIRRSLLQSILANAQVSAYAGNRDDAIRSFDRAELLVGRPLQSTKPESIIIQLISEARRACACSFSAGGQGELARWLVTADLRMLDTGLAADVSSREIELGRAIEHAYLGYSDRGIAILRSLLQNELSHVKDYLATSDPFTGLQQGNSPQKYLVEWLAVDSNRLNLAKGEFFETEGQTDLTAWANSFVETIHSRCASLGLHWSAVPLAVERIAEFAESAIAQKRRQGRSEVALRSEIRLTAIAQELVRRYPNQSSSHLVLSQAHLQSAKNAWNRSHDAQAAESIRKSRDAAKVALGIDPMRPDARRAVEDRERRLQRAAAG